jgi:hypothetical protein
MVDIAPELTTQVTTHSIEGAKEVVMRRSRASGQEQMTSTITGVCADRLPHLRGDFTTCTNACAQPHGHRPATPHRCVDGHEWILDAMSGDLQESGDVDENPDGVGRDDVGNGA